MVCPRECLQAVFVVKVACGLLELFSCSDICAYTACNLLKRSGTIWNDLLLMARDGYYGVLR